MSLRTILAVGELVQAAAHLHGLTGPIQFEVLSGPAWCGVADDYVDMDETLSDEPDLQTIDTMTMDELDALDFPDIDEHDCLECMQSDCDCGHDVFTCNLCSNCKADDQEYEEIIGNYILDSLT